MLSFSFSSVYDMLSSIQFRKLWKPSKCSGDINKTKIYGAKWCYVAGINEV